MSSGLEQGECMIRTGCHRCHVLSSLGQGPHALQSLSAHSPFPDPWETPLSPTAWSMGTRGCCWHPPTCLRCFGLTFPLFYHRTKHSNPSHALTVRADFKQGQMIFSGAGSRTLGGSALALAAGAATGDGLCDTPAAEGSPAPSPDPSLLQSGAEITPLLDCL